jgi:DNA replication and repair protein RecF
LAQRNKLLKSGKASADTLHVWDVQLADAGGKIAFRRKSFLERLKPILKETHSFLTNGKETLTATYEGVSGGSAEENSELLMTAFKKSIEKDLHYGHTSVGIHKDDFCLTAFTKNDTAIENGEGVPVRDGVKQSVSGGGGAVRQNVPSGVDIRTFGSQGQQRTAALSLKLSELNLFAEESGETPILILDDVLSELDKDRQRKLLERIKGFQTLLTCTHFDGFDGFDVSREYIVENGVVRKI